MVNVYRLHWRKPILITFEQMLSATDDFKHRRVRIHKVGEVTVSTVFLNYPIGEMFFETAIMVNDQIKPVAHCSTHKEALKMHKYVVTGVRTNKRWWA